MHGASGAGEVEPPQSAPPTEDTYRAEFAAWLGNMGEEARQLAFLLEREEAAAPVRRFAAESLNQLLHMADMVPEGTEALGYLEVLFSSRLLAAELTDAEFAAPKLPKPRSMKVQQPPAQPEAQAEAQSGSALGEAAPSDAVQGEPAQVAEEAAAAEQAEPRAELAGEPEPAEQAADVASAAANASAIPEDAEAVMRDSEGPIELGAGAAEPEPQEEALVAERSAEAAEEEAADAAPAADEPPAEEAQAAADAAEVSESEEPEPEPAQPDDQGHAVARRLAAQAALVRSFLGDEDAARLRSLVLELRNRASRGRSSDEVLLSSEARAAAANDAREWAELYEVPEFGSLQHDLLRLRTFMKTRVRRTAS